MGGRRLLGQEPSPAALRALVLLAALSSTARAEGPGLILGGWLGLRLGLATELRYDSNIFSSNARAGQELPSSSFILRVLPSIDLSNLSLRVGALSSRRVDFRLHAGMDYREYLTPDANVAQHRAVGIDLGALVSLFPRSAAGVELYDNFLRTNQPPYSYNPYNFDRNTNVFGARLRYAPHGRRLALSVVYELSFDGFEDVAGGPRLSAFNLLTNSVILRASWKVLPKTALFVETSEIFHTYLAPPDRGVRVASYPLHVGAGIVGLITQKLAVNIYCGYGNGFYTQGPSPSSAVIQAELRFKPTFFSVLTLGGRHDFMNSLLGSYFDLDSLSASYSQVIYRLTLVGRFTWERMAFHGSQEMLAAGGVCQDGETMPCRPQLDRVDNYLLADVKAEYAVKGWLLPSVGYTLQTNLSNGYSRVQSVIAPVSFMKHELWLRLAVRY